MLSLFAQTSFTGLVVVLFVAALLLIESMYFLWRSYRGKAARKLERRIGSLAAAPAGSGSVQVVKRDRLSTIPVFDRWLAALPGIERLHAYVLQANVRWSMAQLLAASPLLGLLGYLAGDALISDVGAGVVALVMFAAIPWLYVSWRRSRRLAKIELQLPEALDFLTRALKSGQGFTSALMMAGQELNAPIAAELRAAHDEVTFGVSLERALLNLSERVPLTDVRYFVVAILIQRESGGNLAEVLTNLSRLIRERYKLFSKVRILSANGRFSGWILVSAPFVLGAIMNLVNPDFMSLLWTDPMGISMMKVLLIMMLLGIVILRRIVRIRV